MNNECMQKLLLVCAHACGSIALGSQHQRWKDVIHTDFHSLGEKKTTGIRRLKTARSVWQQEMENAVLARNIAEDTREKEMKDESKKRKKQCAAEAVDEPV